VKLRVARVHKAFGERTVLDDVSLEVGTGEVVCLIGASGSGKSTLLRCINLLEPIDDGTIHLDGVDISEPGLDPDPIRRRIGMVFQSYNLFPHMSVLRNITLAPTKVLRRPKAEARDTALELLGRQGRGLSGPVVGWPAATGGHRAGVGDAARDHAARRGDRCPRPGAGG
jgi:polar amino acid transport system ATP-binding protein